MASEKLYVPKCSLKRHTFDNGSAIVNFSITNVDEFCAFLQSNKNIEKGWINLVISPRKETGKYGETHTLFVDTYVKKDKSASDPFTAPATAPAANGKKTDDIPF